MNTKQVLSSLMIAGALSASLLVSGIALARTKSAVLRISTQQAQGTPDTTPQKIQIGTDSGVNLSFLQTGELIQKVWLDNPSQILMDFDSPLPGSASASDGGNAVGSAGAGIVHLRSLVSPLEFPKGIFSNPRSTALTVVTNKSGTRTIYQFQLSLTSGKSPYPLVELFPSPPIKAAQLVNLTVQYNQTVLSQLSKGLAVAESKGMIERSSPSYDQAKRLIALLNQGTPFGTAIVQTGIPNAVVDRLRSLGN